MTYLNEEHASEQVLEDEQAMRDERGDAPIDWDAAQREELD